MNCKLFWTRIRFFSGVGKVNGKFQLRKKQVKHTPDDIISENLITPDWEAIGRVYHIVVVSIEMVILEYLD